MNFLSPTFLWTLPAALIPLILHLLRRKTPQRILFSHIEWIQQVHRRVMPRRQLRHLLLLILRTLFILSLILFFARPVMQSNGFLPHFTQSSSILFLIDVSASMSQVSAGQTALQRTVTQLQTLSRKLPAHVRLGWISFSDRVENKFPLTLERAAFNASLEKLSVKWRPTNISPALENAFQIFNTATDAQKKILILSDGAKHGWQQRLQQKDLQNSNNSPLSMALWNTVLPSENHGGIVDANLSETENGLLKGSWTLSNPTENAIEHAWTLALGGKTVSQGKVDASKDKKSSVKVQVQWPEGGVFAGSFRLTPDDVPYDDIYFVAGQTSRKFSIVIVDGEMGNSPTESETYYFRTALESPRDPHLESILFVRPEALNASTLERANVVVLANTKKMEDKKALLTAWVEKGGGLFLTAGSNWIDGADPLDLFDVHRVVKNPEKLKSDSATHYFKGSDINNFNWDQLRVDQHIQWPPNAEMTTLVAYNNNDPMLVQKTVGKGNIVMLSTTLDRDWSNLPGKPIYSPLMRQIVLTLADPLHQEQRIDAFAGETLTIPLPKGVRVEQVIAPDGSRKAATMNLDGSVTLASVDLPGIYFLKTNSAAEDRAIAVNIRDLESEGDLTLLKESEFSNLFPGMQTSYVKAGEKSADHMLAVLEGKDLTNLFLVLAILFFVTETLMLVWR